MSETGRPQRLVFVTGTATEVGKTWVGAALLSLAREREMAVAARKPAQSYQPPEATDAQRLAAASGEQPDVVCPPELSYPVPMAPPMAAQALGREVPTIGALATLIRQSWMVAGVGLTTSDAIELALVEGAGGVASPLAADGDSADLARMLRADRVVLVADPALGVINAVRLSVAALRPLPVVVHLNRYDPGDDLQHRNAAWLRDRDGFTVTTSVAELLEVLTVR